MDILDVIVDSPYERGAYNGILNEVRLTDK